MATAAEYQSAFARLYPGQTMSAATAASLASQDSGAGYNTAQFIAWDQQQSQSGATLNGIGAILSIWNGLEGYLPSAADLSTQTTTMNNIVAQQMAAGQSSTAALDIAYRAMGASLANSSFIPTGTTTSVGATFAANWGMDTSTLAGQQAFVTQAFNTYFGRAPSAAELSANVASFQTVQAYYKKAPVTETTTDARAKGDFLGDFQKQAVDFSLSQQSQGLPVLPEVAQVQNAEQNVGNGSFAGGPSQNLNNQPTAPGGTPAPTATLNFTLATDNLTTNSAGATFKALPIFNQFTGFNGDTLNAGDTATDNVGDGTLNATVVGTNSAGVATGFVTPLNLTGITTATVTNLSGAAFGFAGNIIGLTNATLATGSTGSLQIGGSAIGAAAAGSGVSTALQTVNINANQGFSAYMKAAAVSGAADAITVNLGTNVGTATTAGTGAKVVVFGNDSATVGTAGTPQNVYETETINASAASAVTLSNGVTGVLSTKAMVLTGAGSLAVSAGAAGQFVKLTSIDASAETGGVTLTGAAGKVAAAAGSYVNPGAAGLLDNTGTASAITSLKTGSGSDLVDLSNAGNTIAVLNGMGIDLGAGTNTLVVNDAVVGSGTVMSAANVTLVGDTAAGTTATYDWTKVSASATGLVLEGTQGGAITITKAPTAFSINYNGDSAGGAALTVTQAASGTSDALTVTLGTTVGASANDTIGAVIDNGYESFTLNALGGGGGDTAGTIAVNASAGGVASVSVTGNTILTTGTLTLAGNGTSITDTDTGAWTFAGTNAVSISAGSSGGIIMTATDTGNAGVNGVLISGSTTKANVLNGSLGNDTLGGGAGGDTILTGGGGDAITLSTTVKTDHVEFYIGTGAAVGGVIPETVGSPITTAGDVSQGGFFGNAPGATTDLSALSAVKGH